MLVVVVLLLLQLPLLLQPVELLVLLPFPLELPGAVGRLLLSVPGRRVASSTTDAARAGTTSTSTGPTWPVRTGLLPCQMVPRVFCLSHLLGLLRCRRRELPLLAGCPPGFLLGSLCDGLHPVEDPSLECSVGPGIWTVPYIERIEFLRQDIPCDVCCCCCRPL